MNCNVANKYNTNPIATLDSQINRNSVTHWFIILYIKIVNSHQILGQRANYWQILILQQATDEWTVPFPLTGSQSKCDFGIFLPIKVKGIPQWYHMSHKQRCETSNRQIKKRNGQDCQRLRYHDFKSLVWVKLNKCWILQFQKCNSIQ